ATQGGDGDGGKSRPLCRTNRSMLEDTADGSARRPGRPPGLGTGLVAGGPVEAGDVARGASAVGFVVLVAYAESEVWSAERVGSTQHRSQAKARIVEQAVRSFMTNPGPTEKTGVHRVAGGGPVPTGGRKGGRAVSTGSTTPGGRRSASSRAG